MINIWHDHQIRFENVWSGYHLSGEIIGPLNVEVGENIDHAAEHTKLSDRQTVPPRKLRQVGLVVNTPPSLTRLRTELKHLEDL